ncbi:hypothetical protein FACS189427_12380 [Planctomycetales bacterium]|nr:hypothetical protein FACS189427_12380 [Planctomycetales bacterium]
MSTNTKHAFKDFTDRLKLLIQKRPDLITITLSNIFTMRLIGNKTHGDLAEIGIMEFVNQYMYDFNSVHVGKDLYRAKSQEEDITVTNDLTKETFPISLKAYGVGPLQLSTDKNSLMFGRLQQEKKTRIDGKHIETILNDSAFAPFNHVNVLPLIYDEKSQKCNIMVFDATKARQSVHYIAFETGQESGTKGKGRIHPVYRFYDKQDRYICEVRYGGASANALQRGLWTHTKNGEAYFDSISGGWIDYSHNLVLVELFSHALISEAMAHQQALSILKTNIDVLRGSKSKGGN